MKECVLPCWQPKLIELLIYLFSILIASIDGKIILITPIPYLPDTGHVPRACIILKKNISTRNVNLASGINSCFYVDISTDNTQRSC